MKSGTIAPACTKVCSAEAGDRLVQTLRKVQAYMLQEGATQTYCSTLAARLLVTDISITGQVIDNVDFGNGVRGKCGDCFVDLNGKQLECMTVGGQKAWNYDVNYALHGMLAKICSDGALREWTGYGMELPLATMAWIWKNVNQKKREYTPELEWWLNFGRNFTPGVNPGSYAEQNPYPSTATFGTCIGCPAKDPGKGAWPVQIGAGTILE